MIQEYGHMKMTVELDADLYRAIRVEAARADRSVRSVLEEALAAWLERLEDAEDAIAGRAALAEYERAGGVAAEDFFRQHAAETKATYGVEGDADLLDRAPSE
jgi:predicted transcriptional regulator